MIKFSTRGDWSKTDSFLKRALEVVKLSDLDKYKNHIMILTEQTEKLTDELQRIIDEDSELYNLNNSQIQRIQKVIYENKKLLSDEIAALNALENYVRNQNNYGNTINQSMEQTRKTYSIQNP